MALSSSAMQTGSTWLCTRLSVLSRRRRSCMPASRPLRQRTCALLERMEADGVIIAERNDDEAYVAFKCLDPDGHRIEVYWEPLRSR